MMAAVAIMLSSGHSDTDTGVGIEPGAELTAFTRKQWDAVRGRRIGAVFQDPASSLNPRHTIGTIVGTWAGGEAYEVEFARPVNGLATVEAHNLKASEDAR